MFGTPDAQSIAELSKLKKLKHISIVDEEATCADDPTESEKLRKQFPSAKIEIIEPAEFEPELSAEFEQHVASNRKRLLDRVKD